VLDILEYFYYKNSMAKKKAAGRPKKPEGEARGEDLRIPVNASEKEAIRGAADAAGADGMAAWARSVLLKEAQRIQAKQVK
jgi:hypothetical protein